MRITPTAARRGALAFVLLLLVPAVIAAADNVPTLPPGSETIVIPYGKDTQLVASRINLGFKSDSCVASGYPQCTSATATGKGWSWAALNKLGVREGDAGVGFRYVLNQSCVGQEMRASPRMDFHYDYRLRTKSLGTTATTQAEVRLRGLTLDETPTVVHRDVDGLNSWAQGTDVNGSLTPTLVAFDTVYDATVGAGTRITYTQSTGAFAEAEAEVTLRKLGFFFGDVTPPTFTNAVTSADPAPADASTSVPPLPDFLGWYQAPVTLLVNATDPTTSDVARRLTEPISCVERVVFHDVDRDADVTRYPGYAQGTVANAYTADGTYTVEMIAYDHQGNPALSQKRFFGVDPNAPVTTHRLFPGAPTGLDGWYNRTLSNGTGVRLWLDCHDHVANASQCKTRHLQYGTTNKTFTATEETQGFALPEGWTNYTYQSVDRAGNWGPKVPLTVKVDTALPTMTLTPNVSAISGDWYNRELTVTAACTDATSRCMLATVDEGAGPVPAGTHEVRGHGVHKLSWNATDHAGNANKGARDFNVDLVDPPTPVMTAPPHNGYYNAGFNLQWQKVTDDGSGVKKYQYRVNNGSAIDAGNANAVSKAVSPSDGRWCYQMRAMDNVDRVSPWSATRCITKDGTKPNVTLVKPAGGKLTVFGNETNVPGMGADKAVVIGPYTVRALADDPLSGMKSLTLKNVLVGTETLRTCDFANVCEYEYPGTGIASAAKLVKLRATAVDNATNTQDTPDRTTLQVVLHAATGLVPSSEPAQPASAGGEPEPYTASAYATWRADLAWHPLDRGTFVAYEIHRSNLPDFVPSALTRVATIGSPDVTSYRDVDVLANQDYTYRVRYVATDFHLDSHASRVNTVGGGAGEPGECGPLGCREIKTV